MRAAEKLADLSQALAGRFTEHHALLCVLAACSTAAGCAAPRGGSSVIQVVAAENFWGSIASQIGGSHVHVVQPGRRASRRPPDHR